MPQQALAQLRAGSVLVLGVLLSAGVSPGHAQPASPENPAHQVALAQAAQPVAGPSISAHYPVSAAGMTLHLEGKGFAAGAEVELYAPAEQGQRSDVYFVPGLDQLETEQNRLTVRADESGKISAYASFSPYMSTSVIEVVASSPADQLEARTEITLLGNSIAQLKLSQNSIEAGNLHQLHLLANRFAPYHKDYPVQLRIVKADDPESRSISDKTVMVETDQTGQEPWGKIKDVTLKIPAEVASGSYLVQAVVPADLAQPAGPAGRVLASTQLEITPAQKAVDPRPEPAEPSPAAEPSPSAEAPEQTASPSQAGEASQPETSQPSESSAETIEPGQAEEPSPAIESAQPTEETSSSPEQEPAKAGESSQTGTESGQLAEASPALEDQELQQQLPLAQPVPEFEQESSKKTGNDEQEEIKQEPVWLQSSSVSPQDPRLQGESDSELRSSVLNSLGAKQVESSGLVSPSLLGNLGKDEAAAENQEDQAVLLAATEGGLPLMPIALLTLAALAIGGVTGVLIAHTKPKKH